MGDFNYREFIAKLHEQTATPKETIDRAIMRILIAWVKKRTPEFESFRQKGGTEASYLGDHAKRASVDKMVAWEKAEQYLRGLYDSEGMEEIKGEFDAAYDDALEDPWWRESKFSGVK